MATCRAGLHVDSSFGPEHTRLPGGREPLWGPLRLTNDAGNTAQPPFSITMLTAVWIGPPSSAARAVTVGAGRSRDRERSGAECRL